MRQKGSHLSSINEALSLSRLGRLWEGSAQRKLLFEIITQREDKGV